jgi:hypothetical protein
MDKMESITGNVYCVEVDERNVVMKDNLLRAVVL